jgi:hypothetical protein
MFGPWWEETKKNKFKIVTVLRTLITVCILYNVYAVYWQSRSYEKVHCLHVPYSWIRPLAPERCYIIRPLYPLKFPCLGKVYLWTFVHKNPGIFVPSQFAEVEAILYCFFHSLTSTSKYSNILITISFAKMILANYWENPFRSFSEKWLVLFLITNKFSKLMLTSLLRNWRTLPPTAVLNLRRLCVEKRELIQSFFSFNKLVFCISQLFLVCAKTCMESLGFEVNIQLFLNLIFKVF